MGFGRQLFCKEVQSYIRGALNDLVPYVQFKKREKQPWRSVTFSKVEKEHSSMGLFHIF